MHLYHVGEVISSSFLMHTVPEQVSRTDSPLTRINIFRDAFQIQDTMLWMFAHFITTLLTFRPSTGLSVSASQ